MPLKMAGTEKQVAFATDMIEAIKAAAARSADELAAARSAQDGTSSTIAATARAKNRHAMLSQMAGAIAALEEIQRAGSPEAAEAIMGGLDDRTADALMSLMEGLTPRRMGYAGPADLIMRPADAGLVIDKIKGVYYAHCRARVRDAGAT